MLQQLWGCSVDSHSFLKIMQLSFRYLVALFCDPSLFLVNLIKYFFDQIRAFFLLFLHFLCCSLCHLQWLQGRNSCWCLCDLFHLESCEATSCTKSPYDLSLSLGPLKTIVILHAMDLLLYINSYVAITVARNLQNYVLQFLARVSIT